MQFLKVGKKTLNSLFDGQHYGYEQQDGQGERKRERKILAHVMSEILAIRTGFITTRHLFMILDLNR